MWADFTLIVGLLSKIRKMYTFNYETGYGAKGLFDAFNSNPQFELIRFYFGYKPTAVDIWWNVAMWDGILICFIILLMGLVTTPGLQTFLNLKEQTSEVIKFKKKQQMMQAARQKRI